MLYRTHYVLVIYLTVFILAIHMNPNNSESVRNSSADVSGFILYGIGGKRAVEAAGTGQRGTKTFSETLEKLSCPSAPCPSHNIPCSLGHSCSDVTAPQPSPKCTPIAHAQRGKPCSQTASCLKSWPYIFPLQILLFLLCSATEEM